MRSSPADNRDHLLARLGAHLGRFGREIRAALRLAEPERTVRLRGLGEALTGAGREVTWIGTGAVDAPRGRRRDLVKLVRAMSVRWNRRPGGVLVVARTPKVLGAWDREHVGCILGELLSNAAKHGGDSPVVVTIAATARAVTLTVDNAGDASLPRAPFRRFVRGARSRGEGMGVGLWLTDAIARKNGGSLRFTRAPGGGVRAIVRLARA